MIRPPRRAVTRFLIPFIDVLILLFCIFLLMPFVSRPEEMKPSDDVAKLKNELAIAEERLLNEKRKTTQPFRKFRFVVLDIDAESGRLVYTDNLSDGRQEVRSPADAARLINREKARAGEKQVSFILRYPRQLTGYPTLPQVEDYRRWFKDEAMEFDTVPESRTP